MEGPEAHSDQVPQRGHTGSTDFHRQESLSSDGLHGVAGVKTTAQTQTQAGYFQSHSPRQGAASEMQPQEGIPEPGLPEAPRVTRDRKEPAQL